MRHEFVCGWKKMGRKMAREEGRDGDDVGVGGVGVGVGSDYVGGWVGWGGWGGEGADSLAGVVEWGRTDTVGQDELG